MTYNNFDNLIHYYSEMSAMGDRKNPEFNLFGNSSDKPTFWGRIADVNIPLAVLQALDDPLVGWRTIGTNDPQGLADSGAGNILLLLTKAGGHVVSLEPFFMRAYSCSHRISFLELRHYSVVLYSLKYLLRDGRWAITQQRNLGNG